MKTSQFFLRFGFIFLCSFMLTQTTFAAKKSSGESLDRIVVIVNDAPIMQSELDAAIDSVKKQSMANNMPLPAESVLRKQMLDQLIDRKLELQIADQAGMHVTDQQVNEAIATIAKQNNVSVDDLNKKVTSEGMSLADYHKEIREELLLQQLQQQEVGAKITITPEEVKAYMGSKQNAAVTTGEKEYHLEDILIALPDNATPADITNAKNQAALLLAQLRKGTPAQDNTDLGWRKLGEIPAEFSNQAMTMKKGTFSEPIQTANGFHIIHLLGVRNASAPAAANTDNLPPEKEAEQMVYQKKFEKALHDWVTKLRGDAVINMHPDN